MSTPIRVAFVDIDATITNDKKGIKQISQEHPVNNALFSVLRDVMVEDGWSVDDATQALTAHADDLIFWDYQDFITQFNLPPQHAWDQIIQWHDQHLMVYPDAVTMVKTLHAQGLPLNIISNNPILGCLLKLQRAGLGTLEGTPWFNEILAANNLRGQKGNVSFWQNALEKTGLAAEDIAVIGDNPKDDFSVPRQVGIQTFFLVDRSQKEDVIYRDGACLVNNLEHVIDRIGFTPSSSPRPSS